MRSNMKLAVACYVLSAAQSVQAGPLRWRRGVRAREVESTPGELPPPITTSLSSTLITPSIPSTTTILDSTPSTITISSTDPAVADHENGSPPDGNFDDPNGTPRPIFTTLESAPPFPSGLFDDPEAGKTKSEEPARPTPNPTSLVLVPIEDTTTGGGESTREVVTPTSSIDFTTPSSSTTVLTDIQTPSSSFLTPSSSSEAQDVIPTPVPEPTTRTTSIVPVEPSTVLTTPGYESTSVMPPSNTAPGAPLPPSGDSPVPDAGTPGLTPSENVPGEPAVTEPVTTGLATSSAATELPVETPPVDEPQSGTLSQTEAPAPTGPDEGLLNPQPTEQPPPALTTVPETTTIVPVEPTSAVLTQTIGRPDSAPVPSAEPEEPTTTDQAVVPPSTEVEEPTTTTTLTASLSHVITVSPTDAPNPDVPTGQIQTVTMSVSPDAHEKNLEAAREINKIYDTLTADITCSMGQVACINGKLAQCAGTTFDISSCPSEQQKCFAMPSETIDGVTVGCFDVDHAKSVLSGEAPSGPTSISTEAPAAPAEPTSEAVPDAPEVVSTQPSVIEPSFRTTVVAAEPTAELPPPIEPTTTTNFFGTEPMFTAIVPITDDGDSLPPPPSPTNAVADGGDGAANAPGDAGSRTTQIIDGTPTVSITVTVTVTDATATVTQQGATVTVTEKETETVTVDSGDRVDTVSIRN